MKRSSLTNKHFEIVFAIIIVTILLFPLFDLPRPSTLTGHPWKVEILSSVFLLIASIVFVFKTELANIKISKTSLIFRLCVPMVLFIFWSGISVVWANSSVSVAHHTFVWINYFLILILFVEYARRKKSLSVFLYVFGGISSVLLLLIILNYLSTDFSRGIGKIKIRYSKFAEMVITFAPIFWALASYSKKGLGRIVFLVLGVGGWVLVMLSISRGVFLAGVVAFTFMFVAIFALSAKRYKKRVLALAGIWLAVTVGTQFFLTQGSNTTSTVKHIAGKADSNRESSYMRLFTWKVSREMIRENPLVGVGADNFGLEFNHTRRNYVSKYPNDPLNAHAESYFVERSHNEFIQILTELGIVGVILFFSIFGYLGLYVGKVILFDKRKLSPLFLGSAAGMLGFFVSSLFSSFSFRAVQNGIVFFLVLALMLYELSKIRQEKLSSNGESTLLNANWLKPIYIGVATVLLLGVINFGIGTASIYSVYFAEKEDDMEKAERLYDRAILLDRENGSAYLSKASRYYGENRYSDASILFRKAIDNGVHTSLTYYLLARSQYLSGKPQIAENTLKEATEIFNRSIYVHTHYAHILEKNGKPNAAQKHWTIASNLSPREAKSWRIIIDKNMLTATLKAQKDESLVKPNELLPKNVISAIFFDNRKEQPSF